MSLVGTADTQTGAVVLEVPVASIGLYMMFAAVSPFFLYLGYYLLHYEKGMIRPFFPKEKRTKTILWIVIPTVVLLVVGWIIMLLGIMFDPVFKNLLESALGN